MIRILAVVVRACLRRARLRAGETAGRARSAEHHAARHQYGRVVIKLRNDFAPKHAERIKQLARDGFYNNVPFHRVIAGFMAQTGDGEYGDGTGGSKYPDLKAEFSNVPFVRGIVGMARTPDPNSANTQFFIMYADNAGLNGQYTVVGQVVSGMDVVDKIKKGSEARQRRGHRSRQASLTDAGRRRHESEISQQQLKGHTMAKPEDTLTLETTKGKVVIAMRPDLAPGHVARIKELVKEGFYDGIVFHRVIDGFMAQTGCPHGTGTGGSGKKLKAEFNKEPHVRGTVSMARAANPDSGDSQFFICFDDARFLDNQYTAWGNVIEGMDNVDKIKRGEPVSNPDKIVKATMGA